MAMLAGLIAFGLAGVVVLAMNSQTRAGEVIELRQRLSVLAQLGSAGVAGGLDSTTAIYKALDIPGDKQWQSLSASLAVNDNAPYQLAQKLREVSTEVDVGEFGRLADIVAVSDSGGFSSSALQRFSDSLSRSVNAEATRASAARSQLMLVPVGLLFIAFAILLIVVSIQLVSGLSL